MIKFAKILEEKGYTVIFPEQSGKEEQPDLIAFKENEETAVEVETFADHPKQVLRNYEKNVKRGRKVIFVVQMKALRKESERFWGRKRITR